MSQEDFDEYAAELVSMREALLAEIKEAAGAEETDPEGNETENAESEEDEVEVAPAEIVEADGVNAALNLETAGAETLHDKYQKMGQALAKMFAQIDNE